MAKKITFPNRPCPGCGAPIHIKTKKHEACGWMADGQAQAPFAAVKRKDRPPGIKAAAGGITLDDIAAVKAVVDKLGADKVQKLAEVLA